VEALFEDFDFTKALELTKTIGKEASEDLLLKPFAEEIQK